MKSPIKSRAINKSGKSSKGGDQKSNPKSPGNDGEKEKEKRKQEKKERSIFTSKDKLLNTCWKCTRSY